MESFVYHSPTKVYFGKGMINKLGKTAASLGSSALIVYGGGSIKRTGIYDAIVSQLDSAGIAHYDLSGVDPNPKISSVREGVKLVKEYGINIIIGVGGGSSLDCAKAVSGCAYLDCDAWEGVMDPSKVKKVVPFIAIPTLSATGSELDQICVISNPDIPLKKPMANQLLRPAIAIMDPEYTYSVNAYQTGSGTADIFSHTLELYFNNAVTDFLADGFCEAILKTCLRYGKTAIDHPEDYEARSNLMWAASLAINGLLRCGKKAETFCCHAMEHVLSAYYDVTHGAGLAVITPVWMDYVLSDATVGKFAKYGVNVFGLSPSEDKYETAKEAIACTRKWLKELGMPERLSQLGIKDDTHFADMARDAEAAGLNNAYVPLTAEDVINIYNNAE